MLCAAIGIGAVLGPLWREWPTSRQPLFDSQCAIAAGSSAPWPIALESGHLGRIDVALVREGPVAGRVTLRLTADAAGEHEIAHTEVPATAAEDLSQPMRRPYGFVPFRLAPAVAVKSGPAWLWLESSADGAVAARCLFGTGASQLATKSYYELRMRENLALFLDRLLKRRQGVLGSAWLYAGLFAIYVALFAGILWLAGCERGRDGQDGQDRLK